MMQAISQLPHPLQALLATLFTWGITAAGAAMVFCCKNIRQDVLDGLLGASAGVMLAAAFWSLLSPAIEMARKMGRVPWLPALIGLSLGALGLYAADRLLLRLLEQNRLPVSAAAVERMTETLRTGGKLDLAEKETITFKLRNTVVIPGGSDTPSTPAEPAAPEFPFTDVTTDHPFYEDIKYVYEKGLMQGVSEDIFQSATTTTRGMIATILYRMEGEPAVKNASSFKDVADGMFYSNAVAWAAANGIVNGYADGTFQPDQTISREQMAAILYRNAQYKGCDVSVGEDTNILSYTDAAQVAEYAIPAFQWAVGAGIINGTTASTLSPKGSATRGQVAAILHRYCEWIG